MGNIVASIPSEPRLPVELEHIILELLVLTHRKEIPRLMLVAWRVKILLYIFLVQILILVSILRVEPLLYRVIFIARPPFRETGGFPPVDSILAAIAKKALIVLSCQ